MASSSSNHGQRRKQSNKRRQLVRSNSSLLGAIKNIVSAPLAWFASTDDFEDSKDAKGKRRRLVVAPTEPSIDDDDRGARTKRMRVHSPPKDEQHDQQQQPQYPLSHAYLDPPSSAFNQQYRLPQTTSRQAEASAPKITRSASVTLPSPTVQSFPYNARKSSRSTLSPMRNLSISRTMSIDPPARTLSREPSFQLSLHQFHRDISMEPSGSFSHHPSSVQRDLSMPPMSFSSRPSFRMRTSITPQPPHRELSEPPALTTLKSNPTFVRGPPSQPLDAQLSSSSHPAATLGSLVDKARSQTQSPVRQHSSLFYGSSSSSGIDNNSVLRQQTAAEKALHELEVYRTPLLPTRLRSANSTASSISITATSGVPDMFKTRRASSLVLMQDDKRSERLGRKVSEGKPVVNDTKPYAGEGGMKKLLARRKLEVDEVEEQEDEENGDSEERARVDGNEDDAMDGGFHPAGKPQRVPRLFPLEDTAAAPAPAPASSKSDWYSAASASSSTSGSSLRVGRAKSSRNHIARPAARPIKNKFSAAYEDDGDDGMDDRDNDESAKERQALEDAARNTPPFHIPSGFSFANEAKPIEHDSSKAKEPPISSLPFSFSKPAPSTSTPNPTDTETPRISSDVPPTTESLPKMSDFASTTLGASVHLMHDPSGGPTAEPKASASEPSSRTGGIPNFFATSSVLSKPLELAPPTGLALNVTDAVVKTGPTSISTPKPSSQSFSFASSASGAPVKDKENPFWDGEKKQGSQGLKSKQQNDDSGVAVSNSEAPSGSSLFGKPSTTPASTFVTANPATAPISICDNAEEAKFAIPLSTSATPQRFSFNKSDASVPLSDSAFDSGDSSAKPTDAFSRGTGVGDKFLLAPAEPKPLLSGNELGNGLLGGEALTSSTLFGGDARKPSPSTFSDLPRPASSPAPFSFAQPSGSVTPIAEAPQSTFSRATQNTAETPKSLFHSDGFSFGKTGSTDSKENGKGAQPFSFGASSNAASVATDVKQQPIFAFGASNNAPSMSSPGPVAFSFSGGGSVSADVPSKPFTFGSSTPVPPTERPVTPPRNQDQEFRMEESPTRDMQQMNGNNKTTEPRPSLGFNFGSSTPFGGSAGSTATAPTPFSFGTSAGTSSNPFSARESKPEESKPFGGFGQATTASSQSGGFMFNSPKATGSADTPRPSTAGSFSFSTTPTSSDPGPFSFGVPPVTGASNPFGQNQSSSAPSSPSTFGQPPSFSFAPPTQTTTTSFNFSSQPASPAGGNTSLTLPQPTTPGGFSTTTTGSGFGQTSPSSPFNAPTPLTSAPSSGGTLFTIGAAPAPTLGSSQRQIRKLPIRRGGKR